MRIDTRCQCAAYSICFSLFLCAYFFFGNRCLVIVITREITFFFFFSLSKGAFFFIPVCLCIPAFSPPF